MRYIIAAVFLVISWVACIVFSKIIDFLNKDKDWYKAIKVDDDKK